MNRITKVYWDRVNLILETEKQISGDVFLKNSSLKFKLPTEANIIKLNITNVSQGEMLESGEFFFECNGEKFTACVDLTEKTGGFSKVFKYSNNFYALVIDFSVDEKKTLYLTSSYMMKNKKYKKSFRFAEGDGVKGKLSILVKKIFPVLLSFIYNLLYILKPEEKTVAFYSEDVTEPIGNLKVEYEYFKNIKDVKTKGCFINTHNGYKYLKLFKAVFTLAKADVVVVDNFVSLFGIIKKPKTQKFVQLWHAGVGFKAAGYARFGKDNGAHPFRSSHRKYDCVIVDSEKLVGIYQEVFAVKRDVIKPLGMPRLDAYLSENRIDMISTKLFSENKTLRGKKIILFSPTFRGRFDEAYYDYSKIILSDIYNFCLENNFVFLIKMHPFIKEKIKIPQKYTDLIFDYSDYDVNDLIYVSDIMITDYSSCAYEFSFFERPLIFYRYDKTIYEYLRPVHTLDVFSKEQVETSDFDGVMQALQKNKNIDITKRYENISYCNKNSCEEIAKEILG